MNVKAMNNACMIAIDGPSGTGKSTVSRQLAQNIGAQYLNTGVMYRVVTLLALRQGLDVSAHPSELNQHPKLQQLLVEQNWSMSTDPANQAIHVNTGAGMEDVTSSITDPEVTQAVSHISALPIVRSTLIDQQRILAHQAARIVVEGRDIGTVVLPEAQPKIFLTASVEARAKRRNLQNIEVGKPDAYDQVLVSLSQRDHLDSTRTISPLKPADDAIIVDTSDLSVTQVVTQLLSLIEGTV